MPRGDAGRKRCAIYTRKSSEEGLEQEFNSLAAQREACEAFIRSQRNEGWVFEALAYFGDALRLLDTLPDSEPNWLRRIDAVLNQGEVQYALGHYTEHIQALEAIRDVVDD